MKSTWLAPSLAVAIVLLGLALRVMPWEQNRFLEDEALYAYWGLRIADGSDPLLDREPEPVDKPPLYLYTLALSFRLFGRSEAAARIPSMLASTASIALLYALVRQLPGPGSREAGHPAGQRSRRSEATALFSALLLALSPFHILFASTAFTDPLMVTLVLAALLAMAGRRPGVSGLCLGLACASKQQGLLFLPLVVGFGMLFPVRARPKKLGRWSGWLQFTLGLAVFAGGAMIWDLVRVQRPGFLEQSFVSYGRLALAQPAALGQRAAEWLSWLSQFWASPWLDVLLVAAAAGWIVASRLFPAIPRPLAVDWVLLGFVAAFLLLHWLVTFQVWDRYLLGIVPLVALVAARALTSLGRTIRLRPWRAAYAGGMALVVLSLLAPPVVRAEQSGLPVGGDHGAYDGIETLSTFLGRELRLDAVLYDHWLGHHYRFYLYGAPFHVHWYPDVSDLARDAVTSRLQPRYIAFPSWKDSASEEAALAQAGIQLIPVLQTTRRDGSVSFRLYRLTGP